MGLPSAAMLEARDVKVNHDPLVISVLIYNVLLYSTVLVFYYIPKCLCSMCYLLINLFTCVLTYVLVHLYICLLEMALYTILHHFGTLYIPSRSSKHIKLPWLSVAEK